MEHEEDQLVISDRQYPMILHQFERARQDLLQEKPKSKVATEIDDDDILSVI